MILPLPCLTAAAPLSAPDLDQQPTVCAPIPPSAQPGATAEAIGASRPLVAPLERLHQTRRPESLRVREVRMVRVVTNGHVPRVPTVRFSRGKGLRGYNPGMRADVARHVPRVSLRYVVSPVCHHVSPSLASLRLIPSPGTPGVQTPGIKLGRLHRFFTLPVSWLSGSSSRYLYRPLCPLCLCASVPLYHTYLYAKKQFRFPNRPKTSTPSTPT